MHACRASVVLMSYSLAYNTTGSPVVVAEDGRSVGGGEWGACDPDSDLVGELVGDGLLVLVDDLEDPANSDPDAAAAWERVVALREQAAPARQTATRRVRPDQQAPPSDSGPAGEQSTTTPKEI